MAMGIFVIEVSIYMNIYIHMNMHIILSFFETVHYTKG